VVSRAAVKTRRLYRYHDQTRDDLLSVLNALGNQLWVPHQVMAEFWGSREAVRASDPEAVPTDVGVRQAYAPTARCT
jgi:hypothetical protein